MKYERRTSLSSSTTGENLPNSDLTGLPPTAEEVEAFVNDQDPNAFEKVIDRLLASDQYGVKWGRIWLDVARYSDTRGYLNDGQDRRFPYAHAYRDYVIDSFNRDTPYDEFLKEQIAADYFAEEGDRRLAGLGLIRIGRQFLKHQDTIDDRIDVVTRGVLGLTVTCARCHDHKYDAINMADYYGLYGVFDQLEETMPLVGPLDSDPKYPEFKQKLDELQADLDRHIAQVERSIRLEASANTTLLVTISPPANSAAKVNFQADFISHSPCLFKIRYRSNSRELIRIVSIPYAGKNLNVPQKAGMRTNWSHSLRKEKSSPKSAMESFSNSPSECEIGYIGAGRLFSRRSRFRELL